MSDMHPRCPVCDTAGVGSETVKLLRPSAFAASGDIAELRAHAATGIVCSNCGVVYRG